jgi:hypothetical protein
MSTLEAFGGTTVLVVGAGDAVVDGRLARDLMGEAFTSGAPLIAIPVDLVDPAFWDLRSGLAGDILQASVNYRVRLAFIGEPPDPAASSRAFAALVRESNAGPQHWFLPTLEALRERLEG